MKLQTLSPSSSSLTPTEKESKKTTKTKIVCYVDSKIGSFENIKHTPGGGKVRNISLNLKLILVTNYFFDICVFGSLSFILSIFYLYFHIN